MSDITTTKPDAIHPTTGEASSTLSRKENNCYISIEGINSNVPQVAPRTTREYLTSTAISLTQFFFQCRVPGTCFPRKGGVKEMPVKMIASFTALNTQNPRRNKVAHIIVLFQFETKAKPLFIISFITSAINTSMV